MDTLESEQDEKWFNFLKIGIGSGDLKIFHLNFYHRGKLIFPVNESFYRKYSLSLTNADFFFFFPLTFRLYCLVEFFDVLVVDIF